jgi:transcriptional repressor NrdR
MEDKVIDSRVAKDGKSIRRRRECIVCEFRFTTYEQIERADLRVIKRDGRGEPFDRHKLMNGILKACEKRPLGMDLLENIVEDIIHYLENSFGREVRSQIIGAKVMEVLHAVDEVAYVRYASVYRHFQDIGEFINEIQSLEKKVKANELQPDLFK